HVHGDPALLEDRRPACAMELPERDLRLARSRLRRGRETDRDVDEAEADRSVPGSPHGPCRNCRHGRPEFALSAPFPPTTVILVVQIESPVRTARTIPNLWRNALAAGPPEPAYLHQVDGEWREVTWVEAARSVRELA